MYSSRRGPSLPESPAAKDRIARMFDLLRLVNISTTLRAILRLGATNGIGNVITRDVVEIGTNA